MAPSPTRRDLLRGGLLAVGGAAAGAAGSYAVTREDVPAAARDPVPATSDTLEFRGPRQAGVTTDPQPYAAWVGLNLPAGADLETCRRLMRIWTDDIERLMAGRAPITDQEPELATVASRLSVTVGVGSGFYTAAGLEPDRPSWLAPLPAFAIDRLDPAWGQTDLILQVCADSPVAVSHAVRRLAVGAATLAEQRWVQRGFREPLTGSRPGLVFRNLFGQVDGTVQPALDGTDDAVIWIDAGAPRGLRGGSSMVIRRIEMDMDGWDRADRAARENSVGRTLANGAPLTGRQEHDLPDLSVTDPSGFPVINPDAHMARAMPRTPHDRFLRRPYSYDDAPAGDALSNTGLVFVAFQADPVRQFVPVQQRLSDADLLNLWTVPIGSAVYAVLPGATQGEDLAAELLTGAPPGQADGTPGRE